MLASARAGEAPTKRDAARDHRRVHEQRLARDVAVDGRRAAELEGKVTTFERELEVLNAGSVAAFRCSANTLQCIIAYLDAAMSPGPAANKDKLGALLVAEHEIKQLDPAPGARFADLDGERHERNRSDKFHGQAGQVERVTGAEFGEIATGQHCRGPPCTNFGSHGPVQSSPGRTRMPSRSNMASTMAGQ